MNLTISSDPQDLINCISKMEHCLSWLMCERFELLQKAGPHYKVEWADGTGKKEVAYGKGLKFIFRLNDGSCIVLMLYSPMNCVYLFVRRFEDMREANSTIVKPHEDWELKSYHDSCWKDSLGWLVREYSGQIEGPGFLHISKEFTMTEELFNFMRDKERDRRKS
jgi:hypothetical protein